MYASTMHVTQEMIDDARFDIRTYVAERLRTDVTMRASGDGLPVLPDTFRIESMPFDETHTIAGTGFRGFLERLRIVRPRSWRMRGEVFRASIRTVGPE